MTQREVEVSEAVVFSTRLSHGVAAMNKVKRKVAGRAPPPKAGTTKRHAVNNFRSRFFQQSDPP